MRTRTAAYSAAIAAVVCLGAYQPLRHPPTTLEIAMEASDGAATQVFFDTGQGFSEAQSVVLALTRRPTTHRVRLPLAQLRALRIDPMDAPGTYAIRHLRFENALGSLTVGPEAILGLHAKTHQSELRADAAALVGTAVARDPYIVLRPPEFLRPTRRRHVAAALAMLFAVTAALTAALLRSLAGPGRLASAYASIRDRARGLRRALDELGGRLTDGHLIPIDGRVLALVVLCLGLFASSVAFKVTGSSVGLWDLWMPQEDQRQIVLFGAPRPIRSDEWKEVPAALNPDAHPLSPGSALSPRSWGYALLDAERGYAYAWNYDRLLVFLGIFFLLLLLTGNRFWLALLGALWAHLSAYGQWWGSLSSAGYGSAAFLSFLTFLLSRSAGAIVLGAVFTLLFACDFCLAHLYPPWQVPVGYLLLFLLAGACVERCDRDDLRAHARLKLGLAASGLAALLALGAAMYASMRGTIEAIAQTVYPGLRRSVGGMDVGRYFSGLFDVFLREHDFPAAYGNVCESASFILVFPVVCALLLLDAARGRRPGAVQVSLMAYLAFMSTWMLVGLPDPLARLTLLDRVPPARALIGLGVANILITVRYLGDAAGPPFRNRTSAALANAAVVGAALALAAWYGLAAQRLDPFFSTPRILLVAAACGVLAHALVRRNSLLFGATILALLAPHALVQPVAVGFDAVLGKDIVRAVRAIAVRDPEAKWIVYGGALPAKLIKAATQRVFNAKSYPDYEEMRVLDPTDASRATWNRYSAMTPVTSRADDQITFALYQADLYGMAARPGVKALETIGVKYFVFAYPPLREELDDFVQLNDRPLNGMWLFRRERDRGVTVNPMHEGSPPFFRLGVDPAALRDGYLDVSGWVAPAGGGRVGAVYVEMAGRRYKAVRGLRREEPAAGQPWSGFARSVPREAAGTARTYSVVVVAADGEGASAFGPFPLP